MDKRRLLVVTAIKDLFISKINIFENIVEIAMSDELKHLSKCIDDGENYHFTLNHFRDLKNPAVQSLVEVCDFLEMNIASLQDIYNIDNSELNFNS